MRLLPPIFVIACLASSFGLASAQAPSVQLSIEVTSLKHGPSGWQPGGPLRPLYQSAVKAVHDRDFDRAEALCNKGLKIAQGDKAFTDLLNQIPQWRKDTLQAQVTAQYAKAVQLVHEGKLNAGERACKKGLELEPGNASFAELLRDIDSRRNVNLQTYLLDCYQEAATLMNNGKLRAAASKCHEGLKRQPHDEQLVSLLKLIRARENGDDSR